jgi:capsular polysaccharide transport system permease protein
MADYDTGTEKDQAGGAIGFSMNSSHSLNRRWYLRKRNVFGALVVLPTVLVLLYQLFIASSQYESRATFMVRGMEPDAAPIGGIAELVGGAQPLSGAQKEALALRDYLLSPDAIAALAKEKIDIVELYHRDDIDLLSKLRFERPRSETLLEYYRNKVHVDYDADEALTRVSVRAFAPEDAHKVAGALIRLGEARINTFNERALEAGQEDARKDLAEAEAELSGVLSQLTRFRSLTGEFDPVQKGATTQQELDAMEARLISERAALQAMRSRLDEDSPLVSAARTRVGTLERTVSGLRQKMISDARDLSEQLEGFENLKLKQEFAAKRYEAARSQLERALTESSRQRLFLVPVVEASLPERPVSPRPVRTTLAVFAALAAAFAIGWLLLAGIREHQAD